MTPSLAMPDPFAPEALAEDLVKADLARQLTREWTLIVPGEPVSKARPRFRHVKTATRDFVSTYTPKKTARYEDRVRYAAQMEWNRPLLRDTPISMVITVHRAIPTSFSKSKRQAALKGYVLPITRPDWDNYGKIVCDALNEIVYADDAAIVDCYVRKFYAIDPELRVTITW